MSKPSSKTKTKNRVKEAESTGGLDEQLYQITKKTAQGVRRFRIAIGGVVALVVLVVLLIWAVGEFRKHSERELASRFHALVNPGPDGSPPDADAVLPELASLVQSARGRASEPLILKQSVTFLLDSARARIYPKPEGSNDPFSINTTSTFSLPSEPPATPPSKPAGALLDQAQAFVHEAQSRLPADADFEYWAKSSLETIESLRNPPKPIENRPQKPFLPPTSSTAAPAPSATDGPQPEKK